MKLTPNSFFPELQFKEINLNDFFTKRDLPIVGIHPRQQQAAMDELHQSGTYTFGGYGENRSDMWQRTYLSFQKKYTHLGIDINVPYGTSVRCPFDDCHIVDIYSDQDEDVGWGTRLIVSVPHSPWLLVLGHLINDFTNHTNSSAYPVSKGNHFARVGTFPQNGNVFEHLHVQCISWDDLDTFDGYGHETDLPKSPNPFEIDWP